MAINNAATNLPSSISWATIAANLNGGSMILSSSSPGSQPGNITITGATSAINTTNNLFLNAVGGVTFSQSVTATIGTLFLQGENGGLAINSPVTITGGLTATFAGSVSQSSALSVSGTASFSAGANSIVLSNINNDFSGSLLLSNSGANDVSIADKNALSFGTTNVGTGQLTVNAFGIVQTGAIKQGGGAGAVSINGNSGAIILNNAGNDFTGAVSVTNAGANNITIQDMNSLTLTNSNAGAALDVTAGSGITLSGSITSGTTQSYHNQITLAATTTLTGSALTLANEGIAGNGKNLTLDFNTPVNISDAIAGVNNFTANKGVQVAGGFTTAGSQIYNGSLAMTGAAHLTATEVNLNGEVSGTGSALTITANATFANSVSGLSSITINGQATLAGVSSLSTTAGQTFNGPVVLGAATTTFASTGSGLITFGGSTITGAGKNLVVGGSGDAVVSAQIQTGAGSVRMTGLGTLSLLGSANSYTGATIVESGTLLVDGNIAGSSGVGLAASTILRGHGAVSTISGAGTVAPGNGAGILTATAVDGSGGMDFTFEFTKTGSPIFSDAAASENDVLRLTDPTPFTLALTASNKILLDFTNAAPFVGAVYEGGFYSDISDFKTSIEGAELATLGLLPEWTVSFDTVPRTAEFSSGTTSGYVTQFTIVPEPSQTLLFGFGLLTIWSRRHRRC